MPRRPAPAGGARRRLLLAAGALAAAGIRPAAAQSFPARPLRILVPSGPGTTSDAVARFFSEAMARRLGSPVVVENRAGAGALLGYMAAIKAPPDGYTLLIASQPRYTMPLFSPETARFDSIRDFSSIARVARTSLVLAVSQDAPYRSLAELVQAMQARPGELTYASQGVGSSAHLCAVLLNALTGTSANHVAYKETSSGVLDVAARRVDFTCQGSGSALSLVQAGTLRALAVTGPDRWEALPQVPTGAEAGLPGLRIFSGLDFLAPAGVPGPIAQVLSDAILQAADTPAFRQFCSRNAYTVDLQDHQRLTALAPTELAAFQRLFALASGTQRGT
ncbi:tripartite tricarboxylate transporter substrate binding protein [Pseudorhodoferax sp.]|uniref:tripartite tricarboxylate transporter substrate binding protein n=1 Tax=Pseudorhodoferax sp. TaxID=1993553 RepID=UPI0039E2F9D9